MKKLIALAFLFVFTIGSAVAQTYACQFIMKVGMLKDTKKGWEVTGFKLPEPFFLNMSKGLIETKSVTEPPLSLSPFSAACMKSESPSTLGVTHWCSDYSDYLSFSENTLNGGLAKTFGAMQSSNDNDVDGVSVARFKCQKIR